MSAAPCVSSLDTREQVDNLLPGIAAKVCRTLDKKAEYHRRRIIAALKAAKLPRLQEDARRMAECSQTVLLQGSAASPARIVPNRCDSRWCSLCNSHVHRKSRDRYERIKDLKDTMADGRLRFITLTQRVIEAEPVADTLKRLDAHWLKFRRSKFWRDHVVGCIARYELTWSNASNGWHLHIHVIASGWYMEQAELALHWGGVVDIRAVTTREESEVFKYAVKSANLPADRIVEAATALFRRKLTRFYGDWLKIKPVDVVDQAECSPLDRWAVQYITRAEEPPEPGEIVFYTWKRLTYVANRDDNAPAYVKRFAWKTITELLADLSEKRAQAARRIENAKRKHRPAPA